MRRILSLLTVCLALFIIPAGLQSQQPPGGKGGGKGGKGGGGNPGKGRGKGKNQGQDTAIGMILGNANVNFGRVASDPSALFDMLSNGADTVSRSDLQADWQIQMFDQMARGMNISDGQLTRDQFRTAMEAVTGRFTIPGLDANNSRDTDAMAEDFFKRADKNNDGFLTEDEMSDRLKEVASQYDKNGDGKIDLNEYKEFFRSVMAPNGSPFGSLQQRGGTRPGRVPVIPQSDELDSHPQVWRFGHLPMDLPDWFEQLDRDRDGQIALHEWVQMGRSAQEFKMWDRNDDGFITADEILAFVRNLSQSNDPTIMASIGMGTNGPGGRGAGRGGFGGNAPDIQGMMQMWQGMMGGGGNNGPGARDPNAGGRRGRGGNPDGTGGPPGGGRGGRGGGGGGRGGRGGGGGNNGGGDN